MASQERITRAYHSARKISYNDESKFIIFSDVHRGDNSFADDFANNKAYYLLTVMSWGIYLIRRGLSKRLGNKKQ